MAKIILVACGTAIATSIVVANKVEKICKEQGIDCILVQCRANEAVSKVKTLNPDVLISTTQIPGNPGISAINGTSFLTGVKLHDTIDELIAILKN